MLGALLPLRISLDINKYFNETRKLRYLEISNQEKVCQGSDPRESKLKVSPCLGSSQN